MVKASSQRRERGLVIEGGPRFGPGRRGRLRPPRGARVDSVSNAELTARLSAEVSPASGILSASMSQNSALAVQWRRRVGRALRRAELHRERRDSILLEEIGRLRPELTRLASSEPWVVAQTLLALLERLPPLLEGEDGVRGAAADLPLRLFTELIDIVAALQARGEGREALHPLALAALTAWDDDTGGLLAAGDHVILAKASEAGLRRLLIDTWSEELRTRPLYFPARQGASHELSRSLEIAARHRAERLLGELLAQDGRFEYSIQVARADWRRTGDAYELAFALRRAGQDPEALLVARKGLSSPRPHRRDELQALVASLLEVSPRVPDRAGKKDLENLFLDHPSRASWSALERSVPEDQWPAVRKRVLAHLQRHQRAPGLVFELLLEADDVLEADGLAATQPVRGAVLEAAADRFTAVRIDLRAGWLTLAAHRRADQEPVADENAVVRNLQKVHQMAVESGATQVAVVVLRRFCARYSHRKRLCDRLRQLLKFEG